MIPRGDQTGDHANQESTVETEPLKFDSYVVTDESSAGLESMSTSGTRSAQSGLGQDRREVIAN